MRRACIYPNTWRITVTYIGYFLLFLSISYEAFRGCRRIIKCKRSEEGLTRFERAYHLFIALSFLVLLMTCFGVNMLLSGLHSYA